MWQRLRIFSSSVTGHVVHQFAFLGMESQTQQITGRWQFVRSSNTVYEAMSLFIPSIRAFFSDAVGMAKSAILLQIPIILCSVQKIGKKVASGYCGILRGMMHRSFGLSKYLAYSLNTNQNPTRKIKPLLDIKIKIAFRHTDKMAWTIIAQCR